MLLSLKPSRFTAMSQSDESVSASQCCDVWSFSSILAVSTSRTSSHSSSCSNLLILKNAGSVLKQFSASELSDVLVSAPVGVTLISAPSACSVVNSSTTAAEAFIPLSLLCSVAIEETAQSSSTVQASCPSLRRTAAKPPAGPFVANEIRVSASLQDSLRSASAPSVTSDAAS